MLPFFTSKVAHCLPSPPDTSRYHGQSEGVSCGAQRCSVDVEVIPSVVIFLIFIWQKNTIIIFLCPGLACFQCVVPYTIQPIPPYCVKYHMQHACVCCAIFLYAICLDTDILFDATRMVELRWDCGRLVLVFCSAESLETGTGQLAESKSMEESWKWASCRAQVPD